MPPSFLPLSPFLVLLLQLNHLASLNVADGARLRGGFLSCLNDCGRKLEAEDHEFGEARGKCVNGMCICMPGFHGDDCSLGFNEAYSAGGDARNPITCLALTCRENCAFGGVCVSEDTCECYDHWSKGPRGIYPGITPLLNDARPPQQPIIGKDKKTLIRVLQSLGAPLGKGDPCLERWPGVQCDLSGTFAVAIPCSCDHEIVDEMFGFSRCISARTRRERQHRAWCEVS